MLYLALLLHDTGKPEGYGSHAIAGGRLAARIARRLDLDETTRETLRIVIENHLLMARISQLRDLGDDDVIRLARCTTLCSLPQPFTIQHKSSFGTRQALFLAHAIIAERASPHAWGNRKIREVFLNPIRYTHNTT